MGNSLHVYVVVKVMERAISACSNFVERHLRNVKCVLTIRRVSFACLAQGAVTVEKRFIRRLEHCNCLPLAVYKLVQMAFSLLSFSNDN
jgi:hypothetical protein